MAYPERIATLDPVTPDVEVIFRLVSPPEGVPPGFTGVSADGVKFFTGGYLRARSSSFSQSVVSNTVFSGSPTYAGVAGISQSGWGIANYLSDPAGVTEEGSSCVWTKGVILTTYGGLAKEPAPGGAPLGVYSYVAARNTELPSFEGGTVTFTPTYDTVNVDWGFTASFVGSTVVHGASEAPLSSLARPASLQLHSFTLPIDPRSITGKMFGLETAYEASALEINLYILFDFPVSDNPALDQYSLVSTCFSPSDSTDNWALSELSDGADLTEQVLTRFDWNRAMYIDLGFPDLIELNTAIFNHYTPVIAEATGNLTAIDVVSSLPDGWLVTGSNSEYYKVSRDWTTYQRMSFMGGEQAWCDDATPNDNITYSQDEDGTWLALTSSGDTFPPNAGSYRQWVEGAMQSGFTGCTGAVSDVPPAPTIVTGNPIVRSWTCTIDGHDFFVLRLGLMETLVYDTYAKQWYSWNTLDNAVWAINYGFNWLGGQGLGIGYGSNIVVGDDTSGNLYFLSPEQPFDNSSGEDDDPVYFDRIIMGQVPIVGRETLPCYSAWLTTDMGDPAYDGAGVTLYTSDDGGVTWLDSGTVAINQDVYVPEIAWYSLGQIEAPGRLFMLIDDGAVTRIDCFEMNDPDDS